MDGYDIFVPDLQIDSKYSVSGAECQVLSISIKPGESVQSEPGAMMVSTVQWLAPSKIVLMPEKVYFLTIILYLTCTCR
jgi:hypothetical protein